MKKGQKTYDFILLECFKLFLEKGYKEVTIIDIEQAIGMTRGAVFYYVKDKQSLFNAVIEKFIFEKQNINNKIKYDGNDTLLQFIEKYIEGVKTTMSILTVNVPNILSAYLSLSFEALKHYENYSQKATLMLSLEKSTWQLLIENAIKSGEIKSTVSAEAVAITFQSIFYGLAHISSMDKGFDAELLHRLYINYYNALKNK